MDHDQPTILLVEDALDLASVILRELQAQGYRAVHAADGSTALALHAAERPALVILDWMLPGIDGLAVLRRIRQHDTTPVLMLTARGEETDLVVGMEVGADDYLTKPFRPRTRAAPPQCAASADAPGRSRRRRKCSAVAACGSTRPRTAPHSMANRSI